MEERKNQFSSGNGPLPPPQRPLPPPQRPNNSSGDVGKMKVIAGVLGLALLIALGVLFYVWSNSNKITEEKIQIVLEKEQVTSALEQLKLEYSNLRSDNDSLNVQIGDERKKIDLLLEKIKKSDDVNRRKIKEYDREVNKLKNLLKDYVHQVDSLSALNKELQAENVRYKKEVDDNKRTVKALSEETGNLKSMIEKGSSLKIRDLQVTALNNRDKSVTKARQTVQIRACLTIAENNIASAGTRSVYMRVKSPDGSLLTQSINNLFDPADGSAQLIYSGMRQIDYQGQDLEVCVFYKDEDFLQGNYNIEIYLDGILVGTSLLVLK